MSVPIRYFLADGGNLNFEAFYVGFPQVVFDSSGKRRIPISPSHTYESRAVDTTSFRHFEIRMFGGRAGFTKLAMSGGRIPKMTIRSEQDFGRSKQSRMIATLSFAVVDVIKDTSNETAGTPSVLIGFMCKSGYIMG